MLRHGDFVDACIILVVVDVFKFDCLVPVEGVVSLGLPVNDIYLGSALEWGCSCDY